MRAGWVCGTISSGLKEQWEEYVFKRRADTIELRKVKLQRTAVRPSSSPLVWPLFTHLRGLFFVSSPLHYAQL